MASLPPVPPLPTPRLTNLSAGVSMLPPLSRRGTGPGIILLVPDSSTSESQLLKIEHGVPSSLIKWAEESYTVVQIEESALDKNAHFVLRQALDAISQCQHCEPKNVVGLVAYGASVWKKVAPVINAIDEIKTTVVYCDASEVPQLSHSAQPAVHHIAGKASSSASGGDELTRSSKLMQYEYSAVKSSSFALPFQPGFDYRNEAIAHTRNLTHLKRHMNGPYFDLEKIWDEHTYYEFENRSVEHTMATMVQEPYVNHVPTMTGGIGREDLTKFYRDHFIFSNPEDSELELISRTIGVDRVVDEFIYKFTHTKQVDWLLPGIPPTGRYLRIPFTAIVNIRGDRLYHEHIAWDQGTVLRQLEILPEYLPFSYPVVAGNNNNNNNSHFSEHEYQVPVAGVEAARKMVDKNSVASNAMFGHRIRELEKRKN